MGRNKKRNSTYERLILSSNHTREEQTQAKILSLVLLAVPHSLTKEFKSNNLQHSVIIIIHSFVDDVELDVP